MVREEEERKKIRTKKNMKVKKIEVNKINTFIEEHPRTLTWNRILALRGAKPARK